MGATTYMLAHLKQNNLNGTYRQFITVFKKFKGTLYAEATINTNIEKKLAVLIPQINEQIDKLVKRQPRGRISRRSRRSSRKMQVGKGVINQIIKSLTKFKRTIAL